MAVRRCDARLGLLAGLAAALLWSLADMLLVGFVPATGPHAVLLQHWAGQLDTGLALLMLEAPPWRLFWGVYLATFSVVLYVIAVPAVHRLLQRSPPLAYAAAGCLLLGYALSPLGHAGFAYLGLQAQSMQASEPQALGSQIAAFNQFAQLLRVHWLASVCASAIGWLLVLLLTMRGRTALPRWAMLANPLLLAPLIGLACAPFPASLLAVSIGSASLNLAQAVFFAVAWASQAGNPLRRVRCETTP